MDETFFTTPRLRGRRFRADDAPAFQAYRNDPDIARYQGWDGCTLEEARLFVAKQMTTPFGAPGVGFQVAVTLNADDSLIGDCYFIRDKDEPRQAEIGFTLALAYQGHGFATEAVRALLTCVFSQFSLRRVTATTDARNAPSIALLERVGMRREAHFRQNVFFKGEWGDEFVYAVLREEWQG